MTERLEDWDDGMMHGKKTITSPEDRVSLRDIALVFLTIGTLGFGGGMAIIAFVQDYVVVRRRWMEQEEFSHGIAFGQILGPFAVNCALFVGYRLRGLAGAVVAAIALMTPPVSMVIILSALYARFQHMPSLQQALKGMGPAVVALIMAAAYQMGKSRIKGWESLTLAAAALLLSFLIKLPVVIILFIAVLYGVLRLRVPGKEGDSEKS